MHPIPGFCPGYQTDDMTYGVQIIFPQDSQAPLQPALACRGDLVGHGLPPRAVERDVGFRRIEPLGLARHRHHMHPV
jgi:hypothetical protein